MSRRSGLMVRIVAIAFLCFLAYSNSLGNDFLLDDIQNVFVDPQAEGITTWTYFLVNSYHGFYRPIADLFFWLEFSHFGFDPFGYHVVNLILFSIISEGFFYFLLLCSEKRENSFLAACLFAVHPINSYLVDFITSSRVAVILLFMLACLISFLIAERGGNKSWRVASWFFCAAAMISHEVCLILPVYIFLYLYFVKNCSWGKIVRTCFPYIAIVILYFIIRLFLGLRPIGTMLHSAFPLWSYLATLAYLLYKYCSMLFFPKGILFLVDSAMIQSDGLAWAFIFSGALWLCLYLIFVKFQKGQKAFFLSFFIVGFLPVCGAAFTYTPWYGTAMIEMHWVVFSSIGLYMLAANLFMFLKGRIKLRLWHGLVVVVLGSLLMLTRWHNLVWKNQGTYCQYWLSVNPGDPTAREGLRDYINHWSVIEEMKSRERK